MLATPRGGPGMSAHAGVRPGRPESRPGCYRVTFCGHCLAVVPSLEASKPAPPLSPAGGRVPALQDPTRVDLSEWRMLTCVRA